MSIELDEWLQRFKKDARLPLWLTAVFLLLLFSLIWETADFFHKKPLAMAPALRVQVEPLADISAMHLFGHYTENLADLPETNLQLTLQGTEVSLGSARESRALIYADGKAKPYKKGDSVPGGASIDKIEAQRIILLHNGRLEQLKMPRPVLSHGSPPSLNVTYRGES